MLCLFKGCVLLSVTIRAERLAERWANSGHFSDILKKFNVSSSKDLKARGVANHVWSLPPLSRPFESVNLTTNILMDFCSADDPACRVCRDLYEAPSDLCLNGQTCGPEEIAECLSGRRFGSPVTGQDSIFYWIHQVLHSSEVCQGRGTTQRSVSLAGYVPQTPIRYSVNMWPIEHMHEWISLYHEHVDLFFYFENEDSRICWPVERPGFVGFSIGGSHTHQTLSGRAVPALKSPRWQRGYTDLCPKPTQRVPVMFDSALISTEQFFVPRLRKGGQPFDATELTDLIAVLDPEIELTLTVEFENGCGSPDNDHMQEPYLYAAAIAIERPLIVLPDRSLDPAANAGCCTVRDGNVETARMYGPSAVANLMSYGGTLCTMTEPQCAGIEGEWRATENSSTKQ